MPGKTWRPPEDLKKAGLEPWMDKVDILSGQNWKFAISQAIRESDYFIALLSTKSVSKRSYVQKEFRHALEELDKIPPNEIYVIPVRLDDCDVPYEKLRDLQWTDLFPSYNDGLKKILEILCPSKPAPSSRRNVPRILIPLFIVCAVVAVGIYLSVSISTTSTLKQPVSTSTTSLPVTSEQPKPEPTETPAPREEHEPEYRLRSKPKTLSNDDVKAMLAKYSFFDSDWNKSGNFKNDFTDNGDGTVTDRATGLMWQQSGSEKRIFRKDRQACIEKLNKEKFAGYDDWRLPTLEELASLLEPEEQNGLYIDPMFDRRQRWCWSADKQNSGSAWLVHFFYGSVYWSNVDYNGYVRAVRS